MALFSKDVKVEALKRAPLFEGLSKTELTRIAQASEDLDLAAGKVLCKEGGLAREFFVLLEGTVDVTKGNKRIGTRAAPDFFGEIALIAHSPRTATVTAKTPVRCFVLTSRDFKRAMDDNPGIERKVMRALAERLVDLGAVTH
jgi:CRP/FNR family transcriptional regulator, cyclic AMP receptor protein